MAGLAEAAVKGIGNMEDSQPAQGGGGRPPGLLRNGTRFELEARVVRIGLFQSGPCHVGHLGLCLGPCFLPSLVCTVVLGEIHLFFFLNHISPSGDLDPRRTQDLGLRVKRGARGGGWWS